MALVKMEEKPGVPVDRNDAGMGDDVHDWFVAVFVDPIYEAPVTSLVTLLVISGAEGSIY